MRDALTDKQAKVLEFIATHIVERQRPPTRKEIAVLQVLQVLQVRLQELTRAA